MRNGLTAALAVIAASCVHPDAPALQPYHVIPGAVHLDKGPDGNTIVFDAPDGLVVIDTGRHPGHAQAILDHARARGRPIAAIVSTHWHYDHTTGNIEIRAAYPGAEVIASRAIDGADYREFTAGSMAGAKARIDRGQASSQERAEFERAERLRAGTALRYTRAVDAGGPLTIAGRRFEVGLAKNAVSEGDLWIYDPRERVVAAGDLVVDIVPFMDTACVTGWEAALDRLEQVPFDTLIPGHGAPMSRAQFGIWKTAFGNFATCGRSDRPAAECVAGWQRDAAAFIGDRHRAYVASAADYYMQTRLRAAPDERERYCAKGGA